MRRYRNLGLTPRPVHRAILAALLCVVLSPAVAQIRADLVLVNGHVYTVDSENTVSEAVAIGGGTIVAVGSNADAREVALPDARVIDLEGRTVVPGFIDAHVHLLNLGMGLQQLDFVGTTSYDAIVRLVGARAEITPPDEWILGRGWDQNDWEDKEFPNHKALSDRTKFNPVVLKRIDGHAVLVNRRAMELAGIDKDTQNPSGGKILRDRSGEPTGVLVDRAMSLVDRKVPPPGPAQVRQGIKLAIAQCQKYGLTSVHEAGVTGAQIETYKALIDEGEFGLRVYAMIAANAAVLSTFFDDGPLLGYGGNRLTVRSVKAMVDGALGSRGAALLAEYSDDPGNSGLLITNEATLQQLTERALRAGFQVCTHAIGDRGNRTVVDAYEAALKAVPKAKDPRLRVEHAQVVALNDIKRMGALGLIASMQGTHATSDMYWAEDRVGPDRIRGAYAWRKFLDAGCRIANGSDFPVEGVNPLWGFYASITRQDHKGWPEGGWYPEERMTREETLRSFTIDAAYAAFEEEVKGSIEPGKLADLVVLSADIMMIEPMEILSTEVVYTVLGGEVVFEK